MIDKIDQYAFNIRGLLDTFKYIQRYETEDYSYAFKCNINTVIYLCNYFWDCVKTKDRQGHLDFMRDPLVSAAITVQILRKKEWPEREARIRFEQMQCDLLGLLHIQVSDGDKNAQGVHEYYFLNRLQHYDKEERKQLVAHYHDKFVWDDGDKIFLTCLEASEGLLKFSHEWPYHPAVMEYATDNNLV